MVIREVRDEDFTSIFKLAADAVKYQISPLRENVDMNIARKNALRDLELVRQNVRDRPNSHFFVANSKSDELLGYLLMATDVGESTTGIEQAWIFDMAVWDNYWDSEVPERLVQKAEEVAREKGLRHIALQVTCSNERALRFFKSRGYDEERKRMYKRLPFEQMDYNKTHKDMMKALEGVKFKIKFPVQRG